MYQRHTQDKRQELSGRQARACGLEGGSEALWKGGFALGLEDE